MSLTSRILRVGLTALLALTGGLLAGTARADAAVPTISIRATGAVHARGAAIVVVANMTCPAPFGGVFLNIRATQKRADGTLVHGLAYDSVPAPHCPSAGQSKRIAI